MKRFQSRQRSLGWVSLVAFLVSAAAVEAKERWLFIGDSITYGGHYTDYVETWFLLNESEAPEIINLGLGSETVSGLSEEDHPFPRPYVHTRLDDVLDRIKPDVVIACYGMNCGIYHPFSGKRFSSYRKGINQIVKKVHRSGASMILLTPPPYAGRVKPKTPPKEGEPFGYKTPAEDYNDVLERYANWILSLDGKKRIRSYTTRPGIERFMEKCYPREPVHPNEYGHELMAEAVLQGMGRETGVDILDTGESRRSEDAEWVTLRALVKAQREAWDRMLLNDIGHGNPSVMKRETLSYEAAEKKASEIDSEIQALLKAR